MKFKDYLFPLLKIIASLIMILIYPFIVKHFVKIPVNLIYLVSPFIVGWLMSTFLLFLILKFFTKPKFLPHFTFNGLLFGFLSLVFGFLNFLILNNYFVKTLLFSLVIFVCGYYSKVFYGFNFSKSVFIGLVLVFLTVPSTTFISLTISSNITLSI